MSDPRPIVDPTAFARLKALLIERTGHAYYADKNSQLAEILGRRAADSGAGTLAEYLRLLEGGGVAATREWRALESAVTINETFFFRFADQFRALRESILPTLIERRQASRRLRIWSAGCSTGAEPYSIAVVLHDLLGPAIADWRIAITGTDIDEDALGVARGGVFGNWALRVVGDAERARLFVPEGKGWRIRPAYAGSVRFERLNLLDLLDPAAPLGLTGLDLILCRNVLIYFSQEVAGALAGALADRLADDGVLMLGHAEAGPAIEARVASATVGGTVIYLRRDDPRAVNARATVPSASPPTPAPAPRPRPRKPVAAPAPPAAPPPAAPLPPVADHLAIRAALDRGDAASAAAMADALIARDPADVDARFLRALAALAADDHATAEAALGRVLYLCPDLAMAHFLLGLARLGRGDEAGGRQALRNALRSAAAMDGDAPLREGDGMIARDLASSIRLRLAGGLQR